MRGRLIIVMGVSGCGKSTIGLGLADALGLEFYDGDDFHPQSNIDKMASGHALNDTDRAPWLEAINKFAIDNVAKQSIIVACSALKEDYRKILSQNVETIFLFLKGSKSLISSRLQQRKEHFMPAKLLDSQFDTLEEPQNAIVLDISKTTKEVIKDASSQLVQ